MKVIFVGKQHNASRSLAFSGWAKAAVCMSLLGVPLGLGVVLGLSLAQVDDDGSVAKEMALALQASLQEQRTQILELKKDHHAEVSALTVRAAELQARLLRLDALGERLTAAANLEDGEFDFSLPPALGGPNIDGSQQEAELPNTVEVIDELLKQVEDREQQLETLADLIQNRKIQSDRFIAGRPIKKGWLSSRYGRRTDPFTGKSAWHSGVDFAGKMGSDVIAVAAGVVVWSGERYGYGDMIEISHGNGFSTRYAHNSKNLVKAGDVVKKGQVVALMGSSGRSTGPHVHFEVYKHGRPVDPASYINRAHL